jgi:hypothetical protein
VNRKPVHPNRKAISIEGRIRIILLFILFCGIKIERLEAGFSPPRGGNAKNLNEAMRKL